MRIHDIHAREVLDSRGNPTVEVDVILENGVMGRAIVPSGASTGIKEALELRDGEPRYNGLGVTKAVNNVNSSIRNLLIGYDAYNQEKVDSAMIKLDGTINKSNLGANAILGVSMANLKAAAISNKLPLYRYVGNCKKLPIPMMNILNGGMHADNKLDFQEFMVIPQASNVKERIRIGSEVFHKLKDVLKEKKLSTNVGDEGGFAPDLKSNKDALELIIEAIKKANYIPGKDVMLGIDAAASILYHDGMYEIEEKSLTREELIDYYDELINKYPIISIEDPLDENDYEGFSLITKKLGSKVLIIGDDLFVTNKDYLQKGIENNSANSILIKLNQIGTITETIETIKLAKENGFKTIISHRSGETEDTIIADLAVGLDLDYIKTGSISRTDRVCKYNQLIRIEEELG